MELDNLVYIILIVTIFVVSLLGQIRRKKVITPAANTDEVKYSLNDFEKILERKQEYQKIEETSEEQSDIVTETAENEKHIVKHNTHLPSDEKKEKNEIDDGFDINSAIIYSSILERKKFRH